MSWSIFAAASGSSAGMIAASSGMIAASSGSVAVIVAAGIGFLAIKMERDRIAAVCDRPSAAEPSE